MAENRLHSFAYRLWLIPTLVLAVCLTLTWVFWQAADVAQRHEAEGEFSFRTREIEDHIRQRLLVYEQVLRGVAGTFGDSDGVTRQEFHAYVDNLRLQEHYAGIQALEFCVQLTPEAKVAHEAQVRTEGFADYTVRPPGARDVYTAIVYVEPFTNANLRAFGYDMFTEPVRRQAMERARDTGRATLSGKVTLVQEHRGEPTQAGSLLFLPVYSKTRSAMQLAGVEERRAALKGWVLAAFRMDNLMSGLLQPQSGDLRIRIYDEAAATERLMYDSADAAPAHQSRFASMAPLSLAGRTWSVAVSSLPAFEMRVRHKEANLVAGAGVGFSLLLTLLALLVTTGRYRAERLVLRRTAELRESEANFRLFVETVDDLIVVASTTGRLIYANPAVSRRLGYSPEMLTSMHVLDLHSAAQRAEAEGIFGEMLAGARDACPLPLQTRDGTSIPVQTRIWRGQWNGQDCIYGVCKDLSLQESALQKFDRLFHSNPGLMAVSNLPDRRFTDVNDAFLRKLKFSRQEIIGRTALDLGIFAEPEAATRMADELQRENRVATCELKVRARDGSLLDGLFSGEVIDNQGQRSFLSVMVDVTEQKRAEEAVRASEERLRLLLDSTAEAIYGLDTDGACTFCNPACLRLLGYTSPHELIGRNMHWLIHGRHADGTTHDIETCRIHQAFRFGREVHVTNEVFWRADGTSFPVEYWSHPQRRDGRIVGSVVTFLDLTATRAVEEAASRSRGEVERLSALRRRLAQVSTLLVATGPDSTDGAVNRALGEIGSFLHADRTYVFLLDDERGTMSNTHEWCADGVRPEKDNLQDILAVSLPAWMQSLRQRQNIHIPRVADLPESWKAERDILASQGIQSLLAVPMYFGDSLLGFVGFDSVRQPRAWSEEEIDTLRLLGDLLAGLLGRSRLEARLHTQSDQLSALLTSMPDIIFFKNLNGVYLGGNAAFVRFMGRPLEEIVGRNDYDLFSPELAAYLREQDRLMLETGKPRHTEDWLDGPVGAHQLFETVKAPLRDQQGHIIGLLGTSRDVTERRRLQDELQQKHAQLATLVRDLEVARDAAERASRAKSAFVANLSHEIRTPLNAILGYAQILQRLCPAGAASEQARALDVIAHSGEHLLAMINDILSVSKMDASEDSAPRPVVFSLRNLSSELVRMFETRSATPALAIREEWPADVPCTIEADSNKIRQILMNFLGNAVRFTRRGSITLRTLVLPDPQVAAHSGETRLAMEVEDTGPGMSPADQENLFRAFEQGESGRRSGSGTGLGLAISRHLADQLGAQITVRSQVGTGSTFRLTFYARPATGDGGGQPAERRVQHLAPSEPTRTVLVVDDDPHNRGMLTSMLRLVGFQTREADSGPAALALLRDWRPDAVLMDLRMPGMDGIEAMRRVLLECAPPPLPC
jgi:PAS domain S-box-containing protein